MSEANDKMMKVLWFIATPVMLITSYLSRAFMIFWIVALMITAIVTTLSGW